MQVLTRGFLLYSPPWYSEFFFFEFSLHTYPVFFFFFFLRFIIYLLREESTPSFSVALYVVSYSLSHDLYAFEVTLSSVHPFFPKKLRLWCKNQVRAVFSWHLLLQLRIKRRRPKKVKLLCYKVQLIEEVCTSTCMADSSLTKAKNAQSDFVFEWLAFKLQRPRDKTVCFYIFKFLFYISLFRNGFFSIMCGTNGLYCVTKGSIPY